MSFVTLLTPSSLSHSPEAGMYSYMVYTWIALCQTGIRQYEQYELLIYVLAMAD